MKQINKLLIPVLGTSLLLASCGQQGSKEKATASDTTKQSYPHVAITPVGNSPEFPNAQLNIKSVKAEKQGTDSAKVTFDFDVKNYELKMQTSDNGTKMCNNSAQGQHIHFIMDDRPYIALYEPTNTIVLANNSEHYLLAFLSRSYHESLKNKGAAVLYHFRIDEKGNLKKLDEPKTPMVFYSRPKGDYIGKDTANVLLDFYVWNAQLAQDSFKVTAHITNEDMPGQDTSITITKWEPYFIKNLGLGKSKITLSLIDKSGNAITGPETSVSREFHLYGQEPLKQ